MRDPRRSGRTSAGEVANRIAEAEVVLENQVRRDAHACGAAPWPKFLEVARQATALASSLARSRGQSG
jgi:hypothetical protein